MKLYGKQFSTPQSRKSKKSPPAFAGGLATQKHNALPFRCVLLREFHPHLETHMFR